LQPVEVIITCTFGEGVVLDFGEWLGVVVFGCVEVNLNTHTHTHTHTHTKNPDVARWTSLKESTEQFKRGLQTFTNVGPAYPTFAGAEHLTDEDAIETIETTLKCECLGRC
jgi:hypothetical protein